MKIPTSISDVQAITGSKKFSVTTGQKLKRDLGLEHFNFCLIRKVMDIALTFYVVYVDSRYPSHYLSYNRIKDLDSVLLNKIKDFPSSVVFRNFKLTPPIDIEEFNGMLKSDSVVIRIDLAGDYYNDKKMFEPIGLLNSLNGNKTGNFRKYLDGLLEIKFKERLICL
ncbi:hypothetical protein ACFL20_06515 [Spirochaetota bacterium]